MTFYYSTFVCVVFNLMLLKQHHYDAICTIVEAQQKPKDYDHNLRTQRLCIIRIKNLIKIFFCSYKLITQQIKTCCVHGVSIDILCSNY